MRARNTRRMGRAVIAAAAGVALLAGCASTSGGGGSAAEFSGAVGVIGDQGEGGEPVKGGTLKFASYAPVATLDPTKTQTAGTAGGTEMAAVYDLLVRYDSATKEFVPQLAETLEESDDHLTWTMKLRDGVTFSDGTVLDADAVVSSIDRYNTKRGANSEYFTSGVKSTEAADPSTVVFTLNQPWSNFPAMLTLGHGLVVAPSSDNGDQFTPIGAGAFTVESLTAQEELRLTAREDYWAGAPHLDGLRFVAIAGEQPKIEALNAGGVEMIYLRNADTVNDAMELYPGFVDSVSLGMLAHINNREGRPGSDIRVRQAIAYAVDTDIVDQRARAGEGMPGSELFQSWSQWHTGVGGIEPDQAKATELLNQAKADGYDGKLVYVSVNDPSSQAIALAVQAQLNAVGFDATIEYASSITDMVQRNYVDHDYDMSFGASSLSDAAPEIRLYSALDSTSVNNTIGYNNPAMDAQLAKIRTAITNEEKLAAIGELQEMLDAEVPFLTLGAGAGFVAWNQNVYGANPSLDGIMLFGDTWIKN